MFNVNEDRCIGCGACVGTCNEVFGINDEGLATVVNQPTDENINLATEALESCPTGAIEKE